MTGAFIGTLMHGGWYYGADTSNGPLHQVWMQATTMAFLGIVACQIGTAMAARCQRTSLAQTGLMSNPLLLAGIGFEIAFTAAVVYLPALQQLFGTAPPAGWQVVALAPFPFIVWGSDELWRYFRRHRRNHAVPATGAGNGR